MLPLPLVILGLIGLGITYHIHNSKVSKKKLVCIIGETCGEVVESKYGRLLGFPNEIMGFAFYGLFVATGLAGFFKPAILETFGLWLLIGSLGALGFSLLLVGVMAFVLKKWCDYCLLSTAVTILIVLANVF